MIAAYAFIGLKSQQLNAGLEVGNGLLDNGGNLVLTSAWVFLQKVGDAQQCHLLQGVDLLFTGVLIVKFVHNTDGGCRPQQLVTTTGEYF